MKCQHGRGAGAGEWRRMQENALALRPGALLVLRAWGQGLGDTLAQLLGTMPHAAAAYEP